MASALDAVLQLKAQKDAKMVFEREQVNNAINMFQQARQQAIQNRLAETQLKVGMAEKGIKINPDGSFSRDESLMSPLDQLIAKGRAAEAARTLGDRNLFNSITGNNQQASPIDNPIQSANQTLEKGNSNQQQNQDLSQYLNEIDPFTQKPTSRAEQAKAQLENKQKNEQPLSADATARYAGAKLGIDNINSIIGQINDFKGDKKDLIKQANLAIEAENAKDTLLPGGKALYKASKLSRVGDEGKALANNFSTLAESLLRARTGAAAPDPEIVREYARTLLKTFNESPSTWNQKLKNDFEFLKTTHDEIRPLRKDEAVLKGEIKDTKGDKTVYEDPIGVIGKDVSNIASNVGSAISDLPGTAKGIANLAGGVMQKIPGSPVGTILKELPGAKNRSEMASAVGKDLVNKYGGVDRISSSFSKAPVSTVLDLAPVAYGANKLARLGISNAKAINILKQTSPIVKSEAATAQASLTKLKGDQVLNASVKNARENILKEGGYVSQEHKAFGEAIDKIKGSDDVVQNADELLRKFVLANKNETTMKFNTPEMQSVYESLSKKLSDTGSLSEADIVNSMRDLKGKFGTGKVDYNKRINLNAAHDLSQGLSGDNAEILKSANARYSAFKTNEKNIDELLSLYGKAKKTDAVVSSLLSKDLGIEQGNVAKFIGEKTGMNLLDTINYYRGVNQLKDAFWFTRQLDSFLSGSKKVVKTKLKGLIKEKQ